MSSMKCTNKYVLFFKLFLILISSTGIGCLDSPSSSPVHYREYCFYFCDFVGTPQLFTLHPSTMQIDSVNISWFPDEGITASANGKILYLASEDKLVVIDAKSQTLIAELPYNPDGLVGVSPNNQLVAVADDALPTDAI